ncbi:uncharacterized protein LOC134232409 [Saccostrea cucullata]|uniref:uncharacterized protein LOC134232409 n=1 Tax=Saccostrea cuccullata TaxID=36930 RepID=UPI002ED53911
MSFWNSGPPCDFCSQSIFPKKFLSQSTDPKKFCNKCQVILCSKCVTVHEDKLKYLAHDIVDFEERKILPLLPECNFHSSEKCVAHCQLCETHVCLKCILGDHNEHKMKDMEDIFNEKKNEIEEDNEEIKSTIIPKYEKEIKNAEIEISSKTAKSEEMEKEKEKYRKQWHLEVDTIFNKLDYLIKSKSKDHTCSLKSHQSRLRNLVQSMKQTVEQNEKILNTNEVSGVSNYKSKVQEYRDMTPGHIDVEIPSLNTKTDQENELCIELEEYKATLTQTGFSSLSEEASFLSTGELLEKAKVISTVPTEVRPLSGMACVGTDEIWVSFGAMFSQDNQVIKRVNIHGACQNSVTTMGKHSPGGIFVTGRGELIYSDCENDTVNLVRNGKTEVMITLPKGWKPYGLCCTRSNDILVNINNLSKNKIIYYQEREIKQNKDAQGKLIFEGGFCQLFVAENINGDICVSDSDFNRGILSTIDITGKVRFQYDGTAAKKEKSFSPRNTVTDCMGHIIVTDYNNACLHILDQNGKFLKCVDNCGLDSPHTLSIDSLGRLWVGSEQSGEVKVIQYMK